MTNSAKLVLKTELVGMISDILESELSIIRVMITPRDMKNVNLPAFRSKSQNFVFNLSALPDIDTSQVYG